MNDLLQRAFERAAALPSDEQERFARFLLAELESERQWAEIFSRPESEDLLDRLANEALSDHKAGRSTLLDPEDL
ncbi:MAG: hypothetical protein F4030_07480 [Gammaproteobacteria bacterium]|nr:hypothetical protein [Gammaproteobacteria bacterium]MYH85931.1 hypothetical protein [Gammaproteobacteria bacterium]MYK04813.1 hypothetical protein [Gammaproteobacteria bacterium]